MARNLDDRSPDGYAIGCGRSRDLLRVLRYLSRGGFFYQEGVHYYAHRDRPPPINIDGELVDRPPEIFSVVPEALDVLVPKGA